MRGASAPLRWRKRNVMTSLARVEERLDSFVAIGKRKLGFELKMCAKALQGGAPRSVSPVGATYCG